MRNSTIVTSALLIRKGPLGPRFVDPVVEGLYRTELTVVRQRALRFSVIVLSLMTLVGMSFQLYGSNWDWSHPMTGWMGVNLLIAMTFLVLTRSPAPETQRALAIIFALVCGLNVSVAEPLILISHDWTEVVLRYGYFAPGLLAFLPFLLLRMPFAEGMAVNLVVLPSYLLVIGLDPAFPHNHFLMHTNNILANGIAAGAGGWLLDRLQRENFAQHREVESLLLNILPAPIAARLRRQESPIADAVTEVGVVFADIVGFTPYAATRSPAEVVRLLDNIFSRFDELAKQNGLEKIKTIGDAYLAVSGLPTPSGDHAIAVARFALGVIDEVARLSKASGISLDVRVGIDCGPVVAGVIGRHKFSYDVWGDTVNTASRMESHGEAGRIQLTERAARLLGPEFHLERRGSVYVKGKGDQETWWLIK